MLLSSLVKPLLRGEGPRRQHDLAIEPLDRTSRERRRRPWRTICAAPTTLVPAGSRRSHRMRAGSQTLVDDPQPALVVGTLRDEVGRLLHIHELAETRGCASVPCYCMSMTTLSAHTAEAKLQGRSLDSM